MRVYSMVPQSGDTSSMVSKTIAVAAQARMWDSCSQHQQRRRNHIHPYVLESTIGQP